jgi:8-oxo-dGTP pyrophosphatase MutT (NUDIX family)
MNYAAVAYITRLDGRILCVWNKRYAGWTMPGGLVEQSETIVAGMIRELQEETSLIAHAGTPIYEGPTITDRSDAEKKLIADGRGSYVHVFEVIAYEGEPRECEVGCAVTWLTRDEFMQWSPFAKFYEKMFEALDKKRGLQS